MSFGQDHQFGTFKPIFCGTGVSRERPLVFAVHLSRYHPVGLPEAIGSLQGW